MAFFKVGIKRKFGLLVVASMFFSAHLVSAQTITYAEDLALADRIKSTDFKKFSSILAQLAAKKTELDAQQVEELNYLVAYKMVYSGELETALNKLFELGQSASSKDVKLKAYGLAINSLVVSRRYSEVFRYYDEFNALLATAENNATVSHGLSVVTLVFNQINQFEIAQYYAERLIATTEIDRFRCIGMQLKADSIFRTQDRETFDAFYNEALQSCIEAKQPLFAGIIRSYKIEQLIDSAPNDALKMLDENIAEVNATSYQILITVYQALYSQAYLKLGMAEKALNVGEEALKFVKADAINYSVLVLYSTLYEAAKTLGNFKDALTYQEALIIRQRTFDNEKMAGLLAYQLAKADIEVKNQRIAILDKDNELLFLQNNLIAQEMRQTRAIIAALTVVLCVSMYLAYRGLTGQRRFKKIAEFDQLTGVGNRYHFNNQAKQALAFCEKNDKPVAVILFDLDNFKKINDNYGHAAGDWALTAVVSACRNFMRNNDVFGRIGGEEFAVVLPGCQTDKAVLLAEICRDAIAAIDTEETGKAFPLTASFGVSGSQSSGYLLKQLLADADKALYLAKAGGRNQVISFADTAI